MRICKQPSEFLRMAKPCDFEIWINGERTWACRERKGFCKWQGRLVRRIDKQAKGRRTK